tara:strand:+ start:100 stop:321 length:222 start_codon:yes stop_codon:yes gene_type:complete
MLTEDQIIKIPQLLRRGMSPDVISSMFNCSYYDVSDAFFENIVVIDDDIERFLNDAGDMTHEEWYVKLLTQLN